jgi:SAM-dependent methyltransferase
VRALNSRRQFRASSYPSKENLSIMMSLLPKRSRGLELVDNPDESYSLSEYAGNLADIRKVNRFLGYSRTTVRHFSSLVQADAGARAGPIRVLDVATGSADIPAAIVEWTRRQDIQVEVTAVDNNPNAVREAEAFTRCYPEITIAVADGLSLPFEDGSFDIVMCAKTLHHYSEEDAVRLLKEIRRVAAVGYIVMDLRRSWAAWSLITVLTRIFSGNRLTRHDGPLSVLRSYTVPEHEALAGRAGFAGRRAVKEPFWLMVISGSKD